MAHEVKILDVRKLPAVTPERQGKLDRWISYEVDGTTRGLVKVPDESFTEDALKKAIAADVKDRAGLVGKTFTL